MIDLICTIIGSGLGFLIYILFTSFSAKKPIVKEDVKNDYDNCIKEDYKHFAE